MFLGDNEVCNQPFLRRPGSMILARPLPPVLIDHRDISTDFYFIVWYISCLSRTAIGKVIPQFLNQ